jgi:hypothetical protein
MKVMNMKLNAESKRIRKILWCGSAVALGLTALAGGYEGAKAQPHQEWVTINLPNPPAPLPDSAAPLSASSDLR